LSLANETGNLALREVDKVNSP